MIPYPVKLSFIIVEYYSIEEILMCQRSISEHISKEILYEVIVSSNSVYPINERKKLLEAYGTLKWLFNERNGGFAYAMNQGLKVASGHVLIMMNPDVQLGGGFGEMLRYLLQDDSIGIIVPQIKNAQGVVQDSFRRFITPINFLSRHFKRLIKKERFSIPLSATRVDWAIGAFMMMPRHAYEAVKGLDEHYFLYCEDMDFCKRMYLNGYVVVYYPEAEIIYEGTRSARRSWKYARIFFNSLMRYWIKFGF